MPAPQTLRERVTERQTLVIETARLLVDKLRVSPDVAARIAWEMVLSPGN